MADPTKTCTKCGEVKPVADFSLVESKNRNPYRRGYCRACEAAYHRVRVAAKRKDPAWRYGRWATNLKSRYGITKDQFIGMMLDQDFRCAVCARPVGSGDWIVDHDHACCNREGSCGKCVRGLLDKNCNTMIGMAQDNVATLTRAQAYLEVARGSHA